MAAGKELKRLRELAGVSAEKAATLAGVPSERWRKWEQRDADPKDLDRQRVERYFGVPIGKLSELDNFQFIPRGTSVEEAIADYEKQKVPYGDLAKMIENNRLLAIANERYSGIIQEMWAQINSERSGKAPSPGEQDPPDQGHKTDLGTQGELIVPGRHGVRKKPVGKQQQKGS